MRGIPGLTLDPEAEAFRADLREFLGAALVSGPRDLTDLLANRAAWVAASGRLPGIEGAASKLFATEAFQRSVNRLVDVAGPAGLVQAHDVSDLSAFYEYCYRFAPVTTIYGGTSEIQRNLVAQRGLGLPRGN